MRQHGYIQGYEPNKDKYYHQFLFLYFFRASSQVGEMWERNGHWGGEPVGERVIKLFADAVVSSAAERFIY